MGLCLWRGGRGLRLDMEPSMEAESWLGKESRAEVWTVRIRRIDVTKAATVMMRRLNDISGLDPVEIRTWRW